VTTKGISKLEAAQRQLDCAIRLFQDEDSLAVHTLAYASYSLLRELLGDEAEKVMIKLEKSLELGKVPNFSKHRQGDPDAILEEHSAKSVHLTIALAIMLWKEHGKAETEAMQQFSALPDPYKPGYRASHTLKIAAEGGPITDEMLQAITTLGSTGGPAITRKKS
jgi:hypothetical protein